MNYYIKMSDSILKPPKGNELYAPLLEELESNNETILTLGII